ncbi:Trehalose-6-P synthase/phosphatase complex synthase subunit [Podochytrium sp. JEL0797]|nr:Trehalose-6-P synthase/phosphatase complex synthase subunit [Podochytrium sp. JEL0797]
MTTPKKKQRLIMVSNRLPITITPTPRDDVRAKDGYRYAASAGGLVSGINGLDISAYEMLWFGWPGPVALPPQDRPQVEKYLLNTFGAVPVHLDPRIADLHYNGFSNGILWPLFHYQPGEINYDELCWEAYQQANADFAAVLAAHIQDGDLVWIHDYHLMLLPELLRARLDPQQYPTVKIGFFLHIPFPSSEIYRILPVRRQILTGVLAADLCGFHTYDYARHFLSSCARILGVHTMPNAVEFEGRCVHVGTFPIGIDPEKFHQALQKPSVQSRIEVLNRTFNGCRVLVGVDRLDYIKGVPQKLRAYELFLEQHPEWIEKVVLVQVAVPSRQDVEEYQLLRDVVNELVGRINGKFGSVTFMPIHFVHKSVEFEELVAVYSVADACVVSSTRDGMNLVSSEYIACQESKHGVLILSEFAGASQSLNGSIIVNPWNVEELANAFYDALTMSETQKLANFNKLNRYVMKYTAAHWGSEFVKELRMVKQIYDSSQLPRLSETDVITAFQRASHTHEKKIIFLDYDGTLAASNRLPEFAAPPANLLASLSHLSDLPNVYLYILSGRSRDHMVKWFGDTSIGLCAEHGCFYRHPRKFDNSVFEGLQRYNPPRRREATSGIAADGSGTSSRSGESTTESASVASIENAPVAVTAMGTGAASLATRDNNVDPNHQFSGIHHTVPTVEPLGHTSTPNTSEPSIIGLERLSLHQSPELSLQDTRSRARAGGVASVVTAGGGVMLSGMRSQLRTAKRAGDGWLALVDTTIDGSWRDTIRPLFVHYMERTPGSWIEEKEVGITWHYMNADPDFGSWQAAELQVNLERMLSHLAVSIVLGDKTLELRPSSVEKLTVTRSILKDLELEGRGGRVASVAEGKETRNRLDCDFYMSIGDGKTDEPVFSYINQLGAEGGERVSTFTVTVGKKQTEAKYYLEDVKGVEGLMSAFIVSQ